VVKVHSPSVDYITPIALEVEDSGNKAIIEFIGKSWWQ
jgi:hypothetical protein